MNLNLINLDCTQWSKADWNDAYNLYCLQNIYGPKTKMEYYEMVLGNFERINSGKKPLSETISKQWLNSWKNAVAWAKERGCDINGRLMSDRVAEQDDITERVKLVEQVALDTAEKLEYHLNQERGKL